MPMWYFMEKERDELERTQVDRVRSRLSQWQAYHDGMANSTPGQAYTAIDTVADAIYEARRPLLSNRNPVVLDLRVSDEAIRHALERAERGDKYIF